MLFNIYNQINALKFCIRVVIMNAFLALQISVSLAQQEAYESPAGTKFLLYTPPGYSANTSNFPLLLSLHSKGEVGNDLEELTSKNPEQMPSRLIYLNRWPQDLPFIVLTPQLKSTESDPDPQWPAEYIDEVVRHVTANFKVDLNRIYVTGISRGGTGAWTYASAYPGKVAALLPLSGRSDLSQACPIKNIPIWAFHGDGDEVAPTEFSIDMIHAVRACQPPGIYKPRLNIFHARNHNGWSEVYNGTNGYRVFEWLLMFKKNDVSNKVPYVNAGMDQRIALRSEPLHIVGDFFDSDGDIGSVQWKQTGGTALTLNNADSEFLKITDLKTGSFEFELTVTDNKGARNSDKVLLEIVSASTTPAITGLILIDGKTNTEIGSLSEGQIINKSALSISEINIKAIASDGTASVRFSVNTDQHTRTLNSPGPYLIKSQTTGPEWEIKNGEYLICATPYSQTGARGNRGISQCFKVTVTDGIGGESCPGTGKIEREVWANITGTSVSNIPVNTPPSSTTELTIFEGPLNIADNYGARVRGYLCPPITGNYTFWISSDDSGELWLSEDENPANKIRIASVSGWTRSREWTKYASQQSGIISLQAGKRYYIEALHKEAAGGDNLAVGWQLPNGTQERPIPGTRLIPIGGSSGNPSPLVSITNPDDGESFTAPAFVNITATASDSEGSITKVEFYNGTTKIGEDGTSPYTYTWNNVSAGNYALMAKATDNSGASNTSSVDIVVTNGQGCAGAGKITREMWTGISGVQISSIPFDEQPNSTGDVTLFEAPANIGDNYGTRIRGYICPPASGSYTFWISGNDQTELWLSTDENPANKKRIANATGYTNPREWTKYSSQQSAPVNLVANQKYYIEALHKEGVGTDHVAVGWQIPGGALERPIPGNRLSPYEFEQAANAFQAVNLTASQADESNAEVNIYPNPLQIGAQEITISGYEGISENTGTTVEIQRMTGEVIYSERIFCKVNCNAYLLNIADKELTRGVYLVNMITNGKRFSKKLLVK